MKIETQPRDDHQVKITVEIEPEVLEETKQRAARKLARRVKIPGFRPGKAPYPVIVRQLGEGPILEEAIELLVEDVYPKAIEESGIEPYGPGSLDNVASMEPPVFEFVVPLKAEVSLGDYRSIRSPYEPEEVTDEQVEQVLNNLRDRQAILEPADRPAQEGDMVYVRLSGELKQVEEGESSNLIREQSVPVVIRPESDKEEDEVEWPFPGFSRQLLGLSKADEKTIEHTFAEDSEYESLRGVPAEFRVVVEDVKSRTLPELNDEFATSLGEYESMDALRAEIYDSLKHQAEEAYNQQYDEQMIDAAVESAEIKFPPQMLEREIDNLVHNLEHRLENQGMDMDLYLKSRQIDEEALREELAEAAESRLKKSLVLMEIAQAESIQLEPEEVQQEAMATMNVLSQQLSKKDARQMQNQEVLNNIVGNVVADLLTRKSVERLRSIGSGRREAEEAQEAEAAAAAEAEAKDASAADNELAATEAGQDEMPEQIVADMDTATVEAAAPVDLDELVTTEEETPQEEPGGESAPEDSVSQERSTGS